MFSLFWHMDEDKLYQKVLVFCSNPEPFPQETSTYEGIPCHFSQKSHIYKELQR